MPLDIPCSVCGSPLNKPGAILLTAPDANGMAKKFHICERHTIKFIPDLNQVVFQPNIADELMAKIRIPGDVVVLIESVEKILREAFRAKS